MMRKWSILTFAFVSALVSAFVVFQVTPRYRSTAMLLIESSKAKGSGAETFRGHICERRNRPSHEKMFHGWRLNHFVECRLRCFVNLGA